MRRATARWIFAPPAAMLRLVRLMRWMVGCTAVACVMAPPPRPFPAAATIGSIDVQPISNVTGEPIWITGGSVIERVLDDSERVSLEDVLASDLRTELRARGFAVYPAPDGARLNVEIRRWTPDSDTEPRSIVAELRARLTAAAGGGEIWSTTLGPRPFPVSGAVNLGDAYTHAAHQMAEQLIGTAAAARSPNP